MGQVWVGGVELVHLLGEGHDALVGVGGLQCGQFDAAHEETLHLGGVVLVNTLGNDFLHRLAHLVVVEFAVIFAECFLIFADFRSMVVMVLMLVLMFMHILPFFFLYCLIFMLLI